MLDDLKFIHEKDANDTLGTAGNQWKQVLQDYSLNIEKLSTGGFCQKLNICG